MTALEVLPLRWDAPASVGALMTTRAGGVSAEPCDALNLGLSVGDDPVSVHANRQRVEARVGRPVVWPNQVHGTEVRRVGRRDAGTAMPPADALWTDEDGVALAVLVADCLPVLLSARDGRAVAVAHAGWRGLAAGVLESTLRALQQGCGCRAAELVAWLGPCIGPRHFEVGADVLRAFGDASGVDSAFRWQPRSDGSPRWRADLPALARQRLRALGVDAIGGGEHCTYEDRLRFFSHRRDGRTGRQAALVWRQG